MNIRITPLVIAALAAFLYGLYYAFSGAGGNLSGLAVIVAILVCGLCLLLYWALRSLFKKKMWQQVASELLILLVVAFFYYQQNGRMVLHVPTGHHGYILVVYGAGKHPALPASGIFKRDVHLTVPASGVILTSSSRSKGISVNYGSGDTARMLRPGYDLPFAWDTLHCGGENYMLDVLAYGRLPAGWNYRTDTLIRNEKKASACTQL